MSESSQRAAAVSSFKKGTSVPGCSPDPEIGFATVARALWPRKTAAQIAFHASVSERAAKFWLSGDREPSLDIIMVIINEMRRRKRRRA